MTQVYDEFTGSESDYDGVSFSARQRIAGRSFAGEVTVLALQLHRLAQRDRRHQDNTLRSLHDAIAALLASFPVYRTYLDDDEPREGDRQLLTTAAERALRRAPDVTPESMAFVVSALLLEDAEHPEEHMRRVHFRRRFQQVSGPVMAKGVEDTTFFRYHRLLALNEVGAHPDHFGMSADEAHARFAEWGKEWPGLMLSTSTHDTKRSEDARARLHVLSEMPDEWRKAVRAFQRGNRRWKPVVDGRSVPGPNTEYYIYQTLVASWNGKLDGAYRNRVRDHLRKAMRESKVHTSWAGVVEEYEEAVLEFINRILSPRRATRFIERVDRLMERIAGPAAANSLAAVTLKCTVPGMPDIYNGTELPFFALTDPDNRRPVDFDGAEKSLAAIEAGLGSVPSPILPLAKQWLTVKLLQLRRERAEVFADGANYRPIEAKGAHARNLFAFAREAGDATVVVVVPRLTRGLVDDSGSFAAGALANTQIVLPARRALDELPDRRGFRGLRCRRRGSPGRVSNRHPHPRNNHREWRMTSEQLHPALGATVRGTSTEFRVWAPNAKTLELVLRGRDEPAAMTPGPGSYWTATVANCGPGTRYAYRVNGEGPFPDPTSRSQPDGVHEFSAGRRHLRVSPGPTRIGRRRRCAKRSSTRCTWARSRTEGTLAAAMERLPFLADLGA